MRRLLDVQKTRLIDQPAEPRPGREVECDVLIAGGGVGGCAAALAACRAGRQVVLTDETDWLGGQMTSQGVAALDEHRHIEEFGGTRAYAELRRLIRAFYRENHTLAATARETERLNPGNGWVSRLCFEPRAALWALERMLLPFEASGRLTLLLRHRAVLADVRDDAVRSVTLRHLDGEEHVRVRPAFVLDATELGDLLPLTGAEHVAGAESRADTGEPHARDRRPAAGCVQSFTYPFVLERRPGGTETVPEPPGYARNRDEQPYTLRHFYADGRGWVTYRMFDQAEGTPGSFWSYRRLIDARNFQDAAFPHDLALINWPGNDYRRGSLIDVRPKAALRALREAKALALGFCRWLQTECPRDDGGAGYPELVLRADVMGTEDGLAKFPYVREARRIRALTTIVEQDISAAYQAGARARPFADSVGVGLYAIDIHPAKGEEKLPPAAAKPFQIPLSALVPVRLRNLLPACKNIGTTHITNGAYRLHPVEWNVGEAAGEIAVFCLDRKLAPQTLAKDPHRVRRLQRRLARAGVPLYWFIDVPVHHPAFAAVQVLGASGIWPGETENLRFGPDEEAGPTDLQRLARAPRWARERMERLFDLCLPRWTSLDRQTLARAAYDMLSI
jgi:hypothetical protein